ncbi:MAG TPA: hypothetical protein VFM12_07025, partial [Gemmatimonadales bacterium]|nr:hypothetical protein [Gemmatimonadales bacterium]
GGLSRELQYAASPELLLPFLFGRAHFKLVSAESTLPNQGALYYERTPCRDPNDEANGQANGSTGGNNGASSGFDPNAIPFSP